MKDFIGRTIFERDWIVYSEMTSRQMFLAQVLEVEVKRLRVAPTDTSPVWLRTPKYIAILTEPQEWELT